MRKIAALTIGILLIFVSSAMAEEYVFDRILVKVNDGIITESDLQMKLKDIKKKAEEQGKEISPEAMKQIRSKILEKMVEDLLLDLEAQSYGITVDDEDIDEEIAYIKSKQNLSDDDLLELLSQDGLTIADFREQLRDTIKKNRIVNHMVHNKVLVTDTELKKEYEENIDKYSTGEMVDISVIVLPADVASEEVLKRIGDGEMTFAEAADQYSIGPGAGDGGKVNDVMREALAKEWQDALKGLETGEMTEPTLIGGKETIILLRKVKPGKVTPFKEVKDKLLKRMMGERRREIFEEYFEELHEKAVITYMDSNKGGE